MNQVWRLEKAVQEFDEAVKRQNNGQPVEIRAHGSNLGRYEACHPPHIMLEGEAIANLQQAWQIYQDAKKRKTT